MRYTAVINNLEEQNMIAKEQVLKAIQELPQNASIEDAMEKLYLIYKVDRGIKQADSGQKISQEEAKKRMEKWLK
ncbi:MAG: hypothetical protein SCABRO_03656 [Candidatus Scalindua brodae]|uniref:Uncharacterized protein n=1 Tax=Candidatus Scalindua brodae TaxID=237368 RepID=A0A0B0EBD8_9BACT|nr:MAG: hypothetical protein SCABRO_03656 [Candidatus Scalindua brodae]